MITKTVYLRNYKLDIENHPVPFCFKRYDDFLGFVVGQSGFRLSKSLSSAIRDAGFKITPREFAIMNRLNQYGDLNQSQIAQITFKDRPATTRMLDKLQDLGYIKRAMSKEDRRAFDVSLTKKGKQVRDKIVPAAVENIESACKGISKTDLLVTLRTLQQINATLT